MKNSALIMSVCTIGFFACSKGPEKVSITNNSGVVLSNVFISGPRFGQPIGKLDPGASMNLTVQSRGEPRMWISYEANGKQYDSGGKEYFEVRSGEEAQVFVGSDLKYTTSKGVKSY